MTHLEFLAAKVRGADSNADGAAIIEKWYEEKTKHSYQLARSSAKNVRDSQALADGLQAQLAKNFDTCAELLEIDTTAEVAL